MGSNGEQVYMLQLSFVPLNGQNEPRVYAFKQLYLLSAT